MSIRSLVLSSFALLLFSFLFKPWPGRLFPPSSSIFRSFFDLQILQIFFFKMFSKLISTFVIVFAVIATVVSSPVHVVTLSKHQNAGISFNNWGHLSSLANFDNFYGRDNFIGSVSHQTFVEEDRHLVCHTQSVEIIQQRLLVIQEMAKRIVTEQVCDVETQTIVFEQFHSSLGLFRHDLHRTSGHRVGFDRRISDHFHDVEDVDGSLSTHDFGFSGRDVGRNYVVFGGSNWNDRTSPASVFRAYTAVHQAIFN